jgi:hypothetical protein
LDYPNRGMNPTATIVGRCATSRLRAFALKPSPALRPSRDNYTAVSRMISRSGVRGLNFTKRPSFSPAAHVFRRL